MHSFASLVFDLSVDLNRLHIENEALDNHLLNEGLFLNKFRPYYDYLLELSLITEFSDQQKFHLRDYYNRQVKFETIVKNLLLK